MHSEIPEESLVYAKILDTTMKMSLAILLFTFAIYIFEIRAAHVPLSRLPECWGLPSHQFTQQNNSPTGWLWIYELGSSDYMNYIGMILLAGVSVVCYLRILPTFIRKKDWIYAMLIFAEIVVMLLAMSGIFGSGGGT